MNIDSNPTRSGDGDRPIVLHTRVISGQGGGPEKTILNSPRFLDPLGYRGMCVYLRDPGDSGFEIIRQRASEMNAPLLEVDDFGIKDWKVVSRMRERIESALSSDEMKRNDAALIWHGHDYKSNLLGLLLKKHFPGMRLVTTVHGWVQRTWKTPLYFAIDRWCLARYEHVICVSRDLFDASRRSGVTDERLSLIDNGIALDDYEVEISQAEAKQSLGVAPDQLLVIGVGRLSDEKGFDLLIDAVASLIQKGHSVSLAIAGDGAFRESLQRQIDAHDLGGRLQLLGFVADPRQLYRAADVFVLSSYREGLPNVVLEAMTMRVPVLSTRVAGMPDLMQDGDNGIMIPTGDGAAIESSLERLLNDSELRSRLGAAGRKTIEDRFAFTRRMKKVAAIYEQVLNQKA